MMAGSSVGPSAPQFQVVVVGAVLVILAVGLVVLFVVADEIVQREAIVRGDEIDAGVGDGRRVDKDRSSRSSR